MNSKLLITSTGLAAILMGCAGQSANMSGMKMDSPSPATQPTIPPFQAVDLRNTVCPVSGDKVGDSSQVEVYDGKIYHLCCDDCHKDFEKDPGKYEAAVAANPAKFGIKQPPG
jgi:YHS domain-containing protein